MIDPLSRLVAIAALVLPGSAFPQDTPAPDLVLTPVLELQAPSQNDAFVIIRGKAADPARYPVSFRLAMSAAEVCTWFLVAPRVLVTAAHCVKDGSAVTIKAKNPAPGSAPPELTYKGICEASPRYPADKSMDWALCLLDLSFPLPTDSRIKVVGYERLNTNVDDVKRDASIQITGFGCKSAGAIVSETYLVGSALVARLPPNVDSHGLMEVTPNYIEIKGNPSILCAGDSGGPAFLLSERDATGHLRTVIGINSRTVNKDGNAMGYLASASTEDVVSWIKRWAKEKGQRICGVHADARACRPAG